MGESFVKKNGLLYSEDLHTVVGIDSSSNEFTGRVPYGARAIEDEVFADSMYESISLPDSVKNLGACLFGNCTKLQKVKLPATLEELSPYMFSGCTALTKVTLPDNLKSFSEGLFFGCSALTEIPFRVGVTELPSFVFSGCDSIRALVIPDSIKKIDSKAIANCKNLESVVLPAGIEDIAEDAFEGCNSLHNIRLSDSNRLFFTNPEDGCLYKHTATGDVCVIKIYAVEKQKVNFFEETVDEDIVVSDEEDIEEDDIFSAEIGASDDELESIGDILGEEPEKTTQEEITNMENNEVDSIFADIMSDEKQRTETTSDSVGISEQESQVLSEMMDVMKNNVVDNPIDSGAKVTMEELEKLSIKEDSAPASDQGDNVKSDTKTSILIDAVKFSKVIECTPAGTPAENPDLFVIAESLSKDAAGNDCFSPKLEACAKKIAALQDFTRVILLAGLPVENDEFMHFYYPFMSKKNILLACDAVSPSALSDYCKTICEQSRISLDKEMLSEQRKRVNVKNDTLIKLVIKDIK